MKYLGPAQSYDTWKAAAPEPTTAQEEAAWRAAELVERALYAVPSFAAQDCWVAVRKVDVEAEPGACSQIRATLTLVMDCDEPDQLNATSLGDVLRKLAERVER